MAGGGQSPAPSPGTWTEGGLEPSLELPGLVQEGWLQSMAGNPSATPSRVRTGKLRHWFLNWVWRPTQLGDSLLLTEELGKESAVGGLYPPGRSGELALADLGCECTCFSCDSDLERDDGIFTCGAQKCNCFVRDYTEILLLAVVPVLCAWLPTVIPRVRYSKVVISVGLMIRKSVQQSHLTVTIGMVS